MVPKEFLLRDYAFNLQFRMFRPEFEKLMRKVGHYLPRGESTNGVSVKPRERVLHFLHYLGSNSLYRDSRVLKSNLKNITFLSSSLIKKG